MTPTSYDGIFDKLDELAELLDAMKPPVTSSPAAQVTWPPGQEPILWVHAVAALLIGPLFASYAFSTPASWQVMQMIPGATGSLSAVMFAGGLLVLAGLSSEVRRVAIIGLGLIGTWHVVMMVNLLVGTLIWWGDGGPPAAQPAVYEVAVYGGWATSIGLHIRTLVRLAADR